MSEEDHWHIAAFWEGPRYRRFGPVTPGVADFEEVQVLATVDGPFPGAEAWNESLAPETRETLNTIDGHHLETGGS